MERIIAWQDCRNRTDMPWLKDLREDKKVLYLCRPRPLVISLLYMFYAGSDVRNGVRAIYIDNSDK
eukprot:176263-Chlamydomonas_euryale.AAC.1